MCEKDLTERTKNLLLEWERCLCKAWNWDDCKHLLADNARYIVGHDVFEGKEQIALIPKMSAFLYPNGAQYEVTALFGEGLNAAARITTRAIVNSGKKYENFYAVMVKSNEEGLIEELYEFPDSAYAQQTFSYDGFEEYLAKA